MVAPVTGPHVKSWSSVGYFSESRYYRQKRPYNPLPGTYRETICTSTNFGYSTWPAGTGLDMQVYNSALNKAKSRVIARTLDQLEQQDHAALGVALAQYSQAERTIVQRGRQLLLFSRSLLKLRIPEAFSHLRVSADIYRDSNWKSRMPVTANAARRGWRGTAKEYGAAWLEWSWGIAPTVSDIQNALDVLNSGRHLHVQIERINQKTGKVTRGQTSREPISAGVTTPNPWSQNWAEKGFVYYKLTGRAQLGDPNRLLWSQLGLDDPLEIGFEVIPWSFLLAWVSNVETWLKNWSPVRGQYTWTDLCETTGKHASVREWWNTYNWEREFKTRYNTRAPKTSLPEVEFHLKPLVFRPQRAANAIALLASFLRSR